MKFTTGKLRRNSWKKINWLLDNATKIEGQFSTRQIDDSWDTSYWRECGKDAVINFIKHDAMSYLCIWVTADDNGTPIELTVSGQYWQDSFKCRFDDVEQEARKHQRKTKKLLQLRKRARKNLAPRTLK